MSYRKRRLQNRKGSFPWTTLLILSAMGGTAYYLTTEGGALLDWIKAQIQGVKDSIPSLPSIPSASQAGASVVEATTGDTPSQYAQDASTVGNYIEDGISSEWTSFKSLF